MLERISINPPASITSRTNDIRSAFCLNVRGLLIRSKDGVMEEVIEDDDDDDDDDDDSCCCCGGCNEGTADAGEDGEVEVDNPEAGMRR